ncbi:hypothetical protein [Candidatus Colwellia aromaticivorans]|uniref:hypothetical protein n=1 Tax=Candidatus Colwellia aromaticivorans TaxID=2267621 RepID=UPI000DF2E27B|nr:hypothetical protein [Candidatus Colwellia aromaticivorans]
MSSLAKKPNLKEINALKKKLNWGDVPAIYSLVASSLSELDGILSHGFDSAYKTILDRNTWNLQALNGYRDSDGNIQVKIKPKLILRHDYNDMGYELLCYPIVDGERINHPLVREHTCPFQTWLPESMRMLFRINSLVAFSIFTYQNGDEADLALIKYAYYSVEKLIKILSESFELVEVEGYSIAEFYQEIDRRNGNILNSDVTQKPSEN